MTAVVQPTLKSTLNAANPVNIADALHALPAGDYLEAIQTAINNFKAGPTLITLSGLSEVAAITLADAPLAILGLAVTDSTNEEDKGAYITAPTGGTATTAGSGGVGAAAAGAGQVGTVIWDGAKGLAFKAGAKIKAVKLLVWAAPSIPAALSADFGADWSGM